MKHQSFSGIAVYPRRVNSNDPILVGGWLGRKIRTDERQAIMARNTGLRGHIGIRITKSGSTAVLLTCRVKNKWDSRKAAAFLSKVVATATGTKFILRQLPNPLSVSRALSA